MRFLLFLILSFNVIANDFVDKYGRIHDGPVVMGEPSSDNGWFYSAVYVSLGGKINIDPKIGEYCAKERKRHPMSVPGRDEIPISRDEILGLAYLGYLKPEHLDGWNFSPYEKEKFNFIKFTQEALQLVESFFPFKLKHRNYFWKNGLKQINHVAFVVPIQDRHFILSQWGQYNWFYHLVHEIDSLIPRKDRSSRQIGFLKTGKDIQSVFNYYQDSKHPSVVKAKFSNRK